MTANQKLGAAQAERREYPVPLPNPPVKVDAMEQFPILANTEQILRRWYGGRSDVLVGGQGYLCADRQSIRSNLVPDCVVAFGVDAQRIVNTNGYVISEVGKPPEFVLEVASKTTGKRDYEVKRERYAEMGVLEYWRFDPSGGEYHDAPLAGDSLSESVYTPFPIDELANGEIRGYSPILRLYMCWVSQRLLFFDHLKGEYLPDGFELMNQRDEAEERREQAEARRDEAEVRRDKAEAQRDEAVREAERLRELVRRLKSD